LDAADGAIDAGVRHGPDAGQSGVILRLESPFQFDQVSENPLLKTFPGSGSNPASWRSENARCELAMSLIRLLEKAVKSGCWKKL
jgi:hypothetical protein